MGHYKSNLRDLEFNLFEVFNRQELLGKGPYADLDEETARSILEEVNRLATGVIADSFEDADRNPPVFDPESGTVTMPESFKKSYQAYMDAEWYRADLVPEFGGTGAPRSLTWAIAEQILGSNPAVFMFASGPGFAQILWQIGTPEQKRFAELALERKWGATMVLTEPDAGSDVGAGRTKAIQQPDGTWHIEGVKRFITSAEHDMAENIFHLVLARPEGAGPGTKGLSMFLVPKYLVNLETGELGERNGVYVTNVEKKMGLKVSTTCELTFGEKHPAIGYLVGGVHEGIKQMFLIIEYARMMVGTKAIATLSTGYLNALEYAKQRVQGGDMTQMADKTAPRVTITHHPDVRRSLMTQKAYAEGMRALVMLTATYQDAIQVAKHEGREDKLAEKLNDLLLPVVKGFGSERAYALLGSESLQTLGGSGFLQDYPIEQYIRDSKIDTLYEGTTAIQGMDLFFRKILRDNGEALRHLAGEIKAFVASDAGNGRLKTERALLGKALEDVEGILNPMIGWALASTENPKEIYKVGLNTTRLLMALGDVIVAWLLCRQAEVALNKLAGEVSEEDRAFYTGKVVAAQFFCANVLPRIAADRAATEATTLDLMEMPEEAF
ncbi:MULTISPECIES: acyl-CoA dehydrogenase [Thermomonospora]|uniref:Broad-specificity linear acyl-CoA dehydrogenase FadE5 n=1 Tax=Thermomonospora curvata (strain ATCC 19995 / DSM 43183 / JCM 3096 / KCTC 9072 / NBRC 15933 / NCIMB 10081 / Henssen B9) TaxID=471852 RepID=D1A1F3_THECD|nr:MULTISPECIES: acyl-CoA dehydrogenase [Thermomonospora]ACY95875.1 acyl-CoA dehydrogenase domain protein [Thermomonospora curvata DSM 43183]PKK16122.1 MAG: acyl-CoA dehydrogenase [Thermomonospora sp. CIF 1]